LDEKPCKGNEIQQYAQKETKQTSGNDTSTVPDEFFLKVVKLTASSGDQIDAVEPVLARQRKALISLRGSSALLETQKLC
jgi:hypothetical protein